MARRQLLGALAAGGLCLALGAGREACSERSAAPPASGGPLPAASAPLPCDDRCWTRAVITLGWSGSTSSPPKQCVAVSVRGEHGRASLLTAAHCALERGTARGPAWLLGAAGERVRLAPTDAVVRVAEGAPASRGGPSPDLVLLDLPRRAELDAAVPMVRSPSGVRPGDTLSVWSRRSLQTGAWVERAIVSVRPERVLVDDTERMLCHGDSGAPVRALVDGSWRLLGLVSAGPAHCGGAVAIARVDGSSLLD